MFVLCCAMPTFLTVAVVLVTLTPWFADYRRTCLERELSQRIGLRVEIAKCEFPAPATVRLSGVKLSEPETGTKVATIHVVTWVNTDEKVAVRLSQPELQSAMLPFAWRVIHDRFLCQPELTTVPIRLAADDLTIHSSSGAVTMRDVDTWLRPVDDGIEAMIQCVPAERTDAAAVHVSVVRSRKGVLPATDWTLSTGDIQLHCSGLADYLPALRQLGPEATFLGTMKWRIEGQQWSLDLGSSQFSDVDLAELTRGTAHRLTGDATIRLERCQVEPGRELDVSGTMNAGSGFVSRSLLASLAKELRFEINPEIDASARDLAYETMAVRFDFFGSGMTLEGICGKQRGLERLPHGIVLVGQGRGMLASGQKTQSWVGLARSLWPQRTELLAVSPQTTWLFGVLPAPPSSDMDTESDDTKPPRITSADRLQNTPTIVQP